MSPDIVKNLIRKGQNDSVFFIECPLNTSDLQPYTNRILDAQPGYLLIGVKDSGTVVGLKRSEEKLKVIATEAGQNTNLTFHIVKLVADFKVIVITNKT